MKALFVCTLLALTLYGTTTTMEDLRPFLDEIKGVDVTTGAYGKVQFIEYKAHITTGETLYAKKLLKKNIFNVVLEDTAGIKLGISALMKEHEPKEVYDLLASKFEQSKILWNPSDTIMPGAPVDPKSAEPQKKEPEFNCPPQLIEFEGLDQDLR